MSAICGSGSGRFSFHWLASANCKLVKMLLSRYQTHERNLLQLLELAVYIYQAIRSDLCRCVCYIRLHFHNQIKLRCFQKLLETRRWAMRTEMIFRGHTSLFWAIHTLPCCCGEKKTRALKAKNSPWNIHRSLLFIILKHVSVFKQVKKRL